MSFMDFSVKNAAANRPPPRDPIVQLSEGLQDLQRACIKAQESIKRMRRSKVGPAEKNDLDMMLRTIRETEGRLKNSLDHQLHLLEKMPRTEAASKRTALAKLQKDFDRLKMNVQALSSESALVKVTYDAGKNNTESFARTGSVRNGAAVGGSSSGNGSYSNNSSSSSGSVISGGGGSLNAYSGLPNPPTAQRQQQLQQEQQLQFQPMLVGRDVDEALMEERERDIRKMNEDLAMVNEMFQDMAKIVDKQGEHIEEISKATDASHSRAEEGLRQVKQAAAYQPTCTIC